MHLMGNLPVGVLEDTLDSCVEGRREGGDFLLTLTYPFLTSTADRGSKLTRVVSAGKEERGEGSKEEVDMKTLTPDERGAGVEAGGALPETSRLLFLARSKEHLHLLEHPVVTTFLHVKWKSIEPYFMIKLACAVIFIAFINAYAFLLSGDSGGESGAVAGVRWTCFALLVLLTLREVLLTTLPLVKDVILNLGKMSSLQEGLQPLVTYLSSLENWLRLMLILSSYLLLLLAPRGEDPLGRHISASTVLLSWLYGLFFYTNHPAAAVYGTMVTTISRNFFSILLWLFWFVFAFALTFYFLFQTTKEDEDGNQVNEPFKSVNEAVVKTIIMVFTGELDFGGLVFSAPFGKFIFVLFVFLIMLVLMNLLNGLAISDIALIQKESEVNSQIARMKVISDYEDAYLVNSTFFRTYCGFSLVSEMLEGKSAVFRLKKQAWGSVSPALGHLLLPTNLLDSARAVAGARGGEGEGTDREELKEVRERLQRMEVTLGKITEKLAQLT